MRLKLLLSCSMAVAMMLGVSFTPAAGADKSDSKTVNYNIKGAV